MGGSPNILTDNKRIGNIIAEYSNLNNDKIASLFMEASTITANEALNYEIVHDIQEVNILPGNPVVSLVFKR